MAFKDRTGGKAKVDVVAAVDTELVAKCFEWVELGALLSFSTTKDGGALGVTVTVDGEWLRGYVRNPDELISWIEEVDPDVREELALVSASDGQGQGSRRRKRP